MAGVECTSNNYHSIKPKPLQFQGFSKLVGAICYTNDAFRCSCTGDVKVCVICIESAIELPVRAFAVVYSKALATNIVCIFIQIQGLIIVQHLYKQ